MSNCNEDAGAGASMEEATPNPTCDTQSLEIGQTAKVESETEPNKSVVVTDPSTDPMAHLVAAYPKLAERMSHFSPMAMFRRFGALNARNLLYLQSDLCKIEEELINLEREDKESQQGEKSQYSRDHGLLHSATVARDGDTKQKELVLRMRSILRDYNHALIQQSTILQMRRPDKYDIEHLRYFLSSELIGDDWLTGPDAYIWGTWTRPKMFSKELVTLKPREGVDSFSRYLARKINFILDKFACIKSRTPDPDTGLVSVADAHVFKTTFWITSIAAAMAPVLSIVILYEVKTMFGRLAIIAAFNVLVSVLLTVMTEAKRTEVFSVTAAFAAVQVVFVGTGLDDKIVNVTCPVVPS